ncbi:MAG: sel1 repeat family protein, partial [Schwartzia sp.]|nr:sel1 repeat family protein [Schwartzia sp. (in: firmicutes)]
MKRAAVNGEAIPLTALARMYREGIGTEVDINAAIDCYEKAAAEHFDMAECILGALYFEGTDVPKDYEKAKNYFLQALEHGNDEAYSWLGSLYTQDDYAERDISRAVSYFEKGVEKENESCMLHLGQLYQRGCEPEIKPDIEKAKKYLNLAAEKENGDALFALGSIARGEGLYDSAAELFIAATQTDNDPDIEAWMELGSLFLFKKQEPMKALEFYKKALEDGISEGAVMIGRIYSEPYAGGPETDFTKALEWFNKAAEMGSSSAHFFLGRLHEDGRALPSYFKRAIEEYKICAADADCIYAEDAACAIGDLLQSDKTDSTGFHLEANPEEAKKWYEKAAANSYGPALYALSIMYRDGWEGTAPAPEKTVSCLEKAAETDFVPAIYALGCLYESGFENILPRDGEKSLACYRKAAEKGNPSAQYEVGLAYSRGKVVTEDDAEAAVWFKKAAQGGHPGAMCELGELAYFGEEKDFAEAFHWFSMADASGSSLGTTLLGLMYDIGQHVQQDCAKAKELYEKALSAGNLEARFYLANIYRFGRGVPQDYEKARSLYEDVISVGYEGYNAPYLYYQ